MIRFMAGAVVTCLILGAHGRASEEEQLERFLARLGLVELQIAHLENTMNREAAVAEQGRSSRRLADLYAEQLMVNAGDAAKYDDLVRRVQLLLAQHPEANTSAVQVMLLQADYNRAETQITQWIADRTNDKALQEAREILQTTTPRLEQHVLQLGTQVEALVAELEKLADTNPEFTAKENESRRLAAILGRATFFAGWANYYSGLAKAAPDRTDFERAAAGFAACCKSIASTATSIPSSFRSASCGVLAR